jgi:hypothetical protein
MAIICSMAGRTIFTLLAAFFLLFSSMKMMFLLNTYWSEQC